MKRILTAACLLLVLSGFSLSMTETVHRGVKSVAVMDQQVWSDVAAPQQAPVYRSQHHPYQLSDHGWFYPYTRPTPGCTLKVSNAPIDTDGKIGAWSQATTITTQSGWFLFGGAWNQPIYEDAEGIAWKMDISDINPADDFEYNPWKNGQSIYLYTGWGGSYLPNDTTPHSSHHPTLQRLSQDAWRNYDLSKFQAGGKHTTAAPAPPVLASNISNIPFEIAYCRVTERGETALSPAHSYTPPPNPDGWTQAKTVSLQYSIGEFHPQGTLGYHVYIRYVNGARAQWTRIPAPHCTGTPATADDWLFPIWQRQFRIIRTIPNAPAHQPAAVAQSRLSILHRLLRGDNIKDADIIYEYLRGPDKITEQDGKVTIKPTYDTKYVATDSNTGQPLSMKQTYVGDVIVKPGTKFTITCPVIDEWGNGDSGSTGGPDQQKFHRRIRASDFGQWTVEAAPSQSGHTSWPTLLIHNSYSRWNAARIISHGGDALAFSDYSGGQCFGNQFNECQFLADSIAGRVTCGIHIDGDCQYRGHTASELSFRDCGSSGSIAIFLGGNQTANLQFERLHTNSTSSDSRGSVFFIETPSPLKFTRGFYADAYLTSQPQDGNRGVIIRTSPFYPSTLQIEDIWVDAGFTRFIECNAVDGCQLKLVGGKLNVRGTKPALGLFAGTQRAKSTWYIEGVQIQLDPGTSWPYIINNSYKMFEPLAERSTLTNTIIREPNEATQQERMRKWYGPTTTLQPRDEVGYKIPTGAGYTFIESMSTGKKLAREDHP